MSTYPNQRQLKIAALHEAMRGNAEPLRQIQQGRGRAFTSPELEHRRQYLCTLMEREVDLAESIRVLGRYDKSGLAGKLGLSFGHGIYAWLS